MTTSLVLDVKCRLSSVTTGRYQFASKKKESMRAGAGHGLDAGWDNADGE